MYQANFAWNQELAMHTRPWRVPPGIFDHLLTRSSQRGGRLAFYVFARGFIDATTVHF